MGDVITMALAILRSGILDNMGINYVPHLLPCGEEVNQDGETDGCCRTVCPKKSIKQIEKCFKMHKD